VPSIASGHVLLVAPSHQGFSFSNLYLALRPSSNTDGLWLWAVLNSTRGQRARGAVSAASAARLTMSGLLGLQVPIPNERWASIRDAVVNLHDRASFITMAVYAGQSWWRATKLPRAGSWAIFLATRNPEQLSQGVSVSDMAEEVRRGRKADAVGDAPQPGWLPYLSSQDLRSGGENSAWARPTGPVARPGDLLVAEVGKRPLTIVADRELLPGPFVSLVRLKDAGLAGRVAAYLNSEAGQAVRRLAFAGSTVPRLGPREIRSMRIPKSVLQSDPAPEVPQGDARPLPLTLDALLWS
jgi:hypothetical protein